MTKVEELVGKWREKAERARSCAAIIAVDSYEAMAYSNCADELESELGEQNDSDLTTAYLYGVEKGKDYTKAVLEAARLWLLQEGVDADPHSHGIARDSWGKWHIVSSSAEDNRYDTRAEALDAWDKAREEANNEQG